LLQCLFAILALLHCLIAPLQCAIDENIAAKGKVETSSGFLLFKSAGSAKELILILCKQFLVAALLYELKS
jgi:hypothetical protein